MMNTIYQNLETALVMGLMERFPEIPRDRLIVTDRLTPVLTEMSKVIYRMTQSAVVRNRKDLLERLTSEFAKGFEVDAPEYSSEAALEQHSLSGPGHSGHGC